MTSHNYYKGMKEFFGITNAGRFLDGELSLATRVPHMDVIKFDDWVHGRTGDYEEKGQSMREAITAQWGEEAAFFVERAIIPLSSAVADPMDDF